MSVVAMVTVCLARPGSGGAVMVPVSAPYLRPPRLWEAEMGGELPSIACLYLFQRDVDRSTAGLVDRRCQLLMPTPVPLRLFISATKPVPPKRCSASATMRSSSPPRRLVMSATPTSETHIVALIQAAIDAFLADHGGDSAGLANFLLGDLVTNGYVITKEKSLPPP